MKTSILSTSVLALTLSLSLSKPAFGTRLSADGSYLISNNEIVADCDTVKSVNDVEYDNRSSRFDQAICRYHQIEDLIDVDIEKDIHTLQQLQAEGLFDSEQALASLVEGLSHCELANINLKSLGWTKSEDNDDPIEPKAEVKANFCASRANANASFTSIRWSHAEFDYAEGTKSLDGQELKTSDLLDKMAQCYETALSTDFDIRCGLRSSLSDDEVSEVIGDVYEGRNDLGKLYTGVKKKYFGSTSPIGLLLNEKKELAEKTAQQADEKTEILKEHSAGVGRVVQSFNEASSTISNLLEPALNNYKAAYSLGSAMFQQISYWMQGLLLSRDGNLNYGDQLLTQMEKLQQAREIFTNTGITNGYIDGSKTLIDALKHINERDQAGKSNAKRMCEIYYCHLYTYPEWFEPDVYEEACNYPELVDENPNPFCESVGGNFSVAGLSRSPREFCADNGFDMSFAGIRMEKWETEGCFQ